MTLPAIERHDARILITESVAKRAAEHRYLLQLIANGDDDKVLAFARLHGWKGGGDVMAAVRHVSQRLARDG